MFRAVREKSNFKITAAIHYGREYVGRVKPVLQMISIAARIKARISLFASHACSVFGCYNNNIGIQRSFCFVGGTSICLHRGSETGLYRTLTKQATCDDDFGL